MATYAQLEAEPEWQAETEAPAHAALTARLRKALGHTRAQTGSKGDNRHLRGGHRSRDWIRNSHYCSDRSYTVSDSRDRTGDGNWLRASDVGLQGAALRAASARLDAAVRAGRLPCIAEWFGTIDGTHVVGWFQGASGTSDSSHLSHLHFRVWTRSCNDAAQLQLLGDIILGEDDDMYEKYDRDRVTDTWGKVGKLLEQVATLGVKVDAALSAIAAIGTSNPDVAAILAGVDARVSQAEKEIRDAVADLGEGGAGQVRQDA